MFADVPQAVVLVTGGAFLLGLIVATIGSALGARARAARPDPRDGRIRSLEAELRVAQTRNDKLKGQLEEQEKELTGARRAVGERRDAADEQQQLVERLRVDLRDSVRKTRELREELTERATENVRLEVQVRDLETELSLARSTPDLLAGSFLDSDSDERDAPEAAAKRRLVR